MSWRDFPGSLLVKTSPPTAADAGSIPGRGARIPHASWPKNQSMNQKHYCNKDFKINGTHFFKKSRKKKGARGLMIPQKVILRIAI